MSGKNKVILLILAVGIFLTGKRFYRFSTEVMPKLEAETRQVQSTLSERKNQLQKLQEFAQNLKRIKQELEQLNTQLQMALEHLPRSHDFSKLLRLLTELARNSGVDLIDFTPDSAPEVQAKGSFYATNDVSFHVRGPFTYCLLFFDQISRMPRIISIKSLDFRPNNDVIGGKFGQVSVDTAAMISSYRFVD